MNSKGKVLILHNPISGSGRAALAAERVRHFINGANFEVTLRETWRKGEVDLAELKSSVVDYSAICICGGDGTVAQCVTDLSGIEVPIYIYPTGNENLLARYLKMTADPAECLRRIERRDVQDFALPAINGVFFTTMVSVGLDSFVVRAISQSRTSAIGKRGYILPTLRELVRFKPPRMDVKVDGVRWVENEPGFLVLGNTPLYAGDIGLVPEARPQRESIAVRFFPYRECRSIYWRMFFAFVSGGKVKLTGSRFIMAKNVSISSAAETRVPVQGDGDYLCNLPAEVAAGVGKFTFFA